MNQLTPEQIQERFGKLPKELQEMLQSDEILEKIRIIGKGEDLLIDQIGELIDQIVLIVLGSAKSSSFVADISSRLSISPDRAQKIAEKINSEIFEGVKKNLITEEKPDEATTAESSVSSLERAGGFEIERASMRESSLEDKNPVTPRDRNDLLAGLENPAPVQSRMASRGAAMNEEPKKEPLVEQLLHGSTAIPHETIAHEPDQYREPLV